MTDYRAITVKPPWAQAIAAGRKLVENRSAGFPKGWRGPVLIHASAAWSQRGAEDPRILDWYVGVGVRDLPGYTASPGQLDSTGWARGCVLAVAELVDAHLGQGGCCAPWGESGYVDSAGRAVNTVTHLRFENVRRLPPIPARGRLGLWAPDTDLADEVDAALAEGC